VESPLLRLWNKDVKVLRNVRSFLQKTALSFQSYSIVQVSISKTQNCYRIFALSMCMPIGSLTSLIPSESVTILFHPHPCLLLVLYLSLGHRFISVIRFSVFAPCSPPPMPGQLSWDFQWTKWQWDKIFYQYFGFPPSVSFSLCSIPICRSTVGSV
jgi:hypothetical protein